MVLFLTKKKKMKSNYAYFLIILGLFFFTAAFGQKEPQKAGKIKDGKLVITIDLEWDSLQQAKFAGLFDLDSILVDAIFNEYVIYINDSTDWTARLKNGGVMELSKEIDKSDGFAPEKFILSMLPELQESPPFVSIPVTYGINDFIDNDVFSYQNQTACFVLPDYENAKAVFLSGSFNQWSTMQLPMEKHGSVWEVCIELPPGKHLYKFIVDGRWMPDPNNRLRERDGHGGHNSVVYCYNHVFELDGYQRAKRVLVSGSFNNWSTRELRMKPTATGWELPVFLREGTHSYKFIVDGIWITDPDNPVTRPDGHGNENSFIGIGDTLMFRLGNFHLAERVVLTGTFNAWNQSELMMEKKEDGWMLPFVLGAGNYEYKYIVDGQWIVDPDNPYTVGTGDYINSYLAYKPNHLFVLNGFAEAESVIVTGSFNGWNRWDYRMVFRDGQWIFPMHLQAGRYSYKFIVDGNWITDPDNPLWEKNEFGEENSVLWIEF